MLRSWNRVLKMDKIRITHKIFDYSYKLCYDMKQLFSKINDNMTYDDRKYYM